MYVHFARKAIYSKMNSMNDVLVYVCIKNNWEPVFFFFNSCLVIFGWFFIYCMMMITIVIKEKQKRLVYLRIFWMCVCVCNIDRRYIHTKLLWIENIRSEGQDIQLLISKIIDSFSYNGLYSL